MRKIQEAILLSAFLGLAGCATVPVMKAPPGASLPSADGVPICENAAARIYANYKTARVNDCQVTGAESFNFTIRPENTPINDSAWYGFRVDPKASGTLRVTLNYENGKHRYPPKYSYDGSSWLVLPDTRINKIKKDETVMTLDLAAASFFISGQEIFTAAAHDSWTQGAAQKPFVTQSVIGQSVDGHPIAMLEAVEGAINKPYVVLVGRQHPPEVTGALAMIPFMETVLGSTELAKEFRTKFNVLMIPMINPDGVGAGHWRHNKGGMDLNRDWGPFTQPETQAVEGALERFKSGDDEVVLFLDFHSTWRNLLYTQTDEEVTDPPFFARDWLKAVDDRLEDEVYEFTREASPNSGKPVSKNYMWETYGIPAITYEVGDHTSREGIDTSAKIFAEEMMSLLLSPAEKGPK